VGLLAAVVFALLGSVGAVTAAGSVIYFGSRSRPLILGLVSYATGTLLAAALIGMIPAASEKTDVTTVGTWVLAGLLVFFVLERLMLLRHVHMEHHPRRASAELILVGDAVHNVMDGIAIGAAFADGGALGVTTALAVIVHEVAQEVGDFAILLDGGFSRGRAKTYNLASSLGTIPAAAVAYLLATGVEVAVPALLGIAAASFLYIALADLVPRHHERPTALDLAWQLPLITLGILSIAGIAQLE
jgi:zinc and cadmium transporter